jgi:hypothetical protein
LSPRITAASASFAEARAAPATSVTMALSFGLTRDGGEMGVEDLDWAHRFGRNQRCQFHGRLAAQALGHIGFRYLPDQ